MWGGGGCCGLAVNGIAVASPHLPKLARTGPHPPLAGELHCTLTLSSGNSPFFLSRGTSPCPTSSVCGFGNPSYLLRALLEPRTCPEAVKPLKAHMFGSGLGVCKFWVHLYLPALQDFEVWVCAAGKVQMEAPGRAQPSRFQLHMAGFAGSAPKGSSGREGPAAALPGDCGATPPHPSPRQGRFHSAVGTVGVLCGNLLVLWPVSLAHVNQVVMLLGEEALEPDHCTPRELLGGLA